MTHRQTKEAELVQEFLKGFSRGEQDLLCGTLSGQLSLQELAEKHKRESGQDLGDGQHPVAAVSGGLLGHVAFLAGINRVGMTLSHQVAGSKIRQADGKISESLRRFFDLVVSKHLTEVPHVKSSAGDLLRLAYFYHKQGGQITEELFDAMGFEKSRGRVRGELTLPKCLIEEAEALKPVYDAVVQKGVSSYRELFGKETPSSRKSADEQFIACMAVEDVLEDRNAIREYQKMAEGKETPFVPVILRDHLAGIQYILSETEEKFVPVPTDEKDAMEFAAHFPEGKNGEFLAHQLIEGNRVYRKAFWERSGHKSPAANSGCSDSRLPPEAFGGPVAEKNRYTFRNVGASLSSNGVLKPEARVFAALMYLKGIGLLHFAHTCCGAKEAETAYHQEGKFVSEAFREMGEDAQTLFEEVMSHGGTQEDVLKYYNKKVGFSIGNIANCMSIAQVEMDSDALRKEFPQLDVIGGVMDIQPGNEKRLYVCHKSKRYRPVPVIPSLRPDSLEQSGARRPNGGSQRASSPATLHG